MVKIEIVVRGAEVMTDLYELFDDKVLLYAKNRPTYSECFIEYLKKYLRLNESDLGADIGAGTGQLTRVLADNFNTIYAVDPNSSMIKECQRQLMSYENIIYKCCKADSMDFETDLLDYATIAQAFHLFNDSISCSELKRVLKARGKAIIVYNMKNHESDLFLANEKVLTRYCPLYERKFHATEFKDTTFQERFEKTSYNYCFFHNNNTEYLDLDTFICRTLSSSYSITPVNPAYENYINELEEVFYCFEEDNMVKMELSTVIYSGILR